MTAVRKVKLSVTLSSDLVKAIDGEAAARAGRTRSSVLEAWLRRAEHAARVREVEEAVAAYYDARDDEAREDDDALSSALSTATRRVQFDEEPSPPARRPRGAR
jgi:hypothetical protein